VTLFSEHSWDSSGTKMIGCGLDNQGAVTGTGRVLHFANTSKPPLGPNQPQIQYIPRTSPSTEILNARSFTSMSPTHLPGVVLW